MGAVAAAPRAAAAVALTGAAAAGRHAQGRAQLETLLPLLRWCLSLTVAPAAALRLAAACRENMAAVACSAAHRCCPCCWRFFDRRYRQAAVTIGWWQSVWTWHARRGGDCGGVAGPETLPGEPRRETAAAFHAVLTCCEQSARCSWRFPFTATLSSAATFTFLQAQTNWTVDTLCHCASPHTVKAFSIVISAVCEFTWLAHGEVTP